MKTSKILLTSFIIPLIFAGCGGGDKGNDNGTTANFKTYENSEISINYHYQWEILDPSNFTSNVPKETVVAFRSNLKNDIFTANINITADDVEENISSEDFAKSSIELVKNSLVDFTEISRTPIKTKSGKEEIPAIEVQIEGRKSVSEDVIHFRQIYVVKNLKGYIVTGAYKKNEDESIVKIVDEMLDSFALK